MGERFVLSMECDNAAFAEGEREAEVARILRRTAQRLEDLEVAIGNGGGSLLDVNGNRVGSFAFVLEVDYDAVVAYAKAQGWDPYLPSGEYDPAVISQASAGLAAQGAMTDEEWEASARG